MRSFKNKNILITAGPVWVPLDKVRVITNIFGGALGYVIAVEASKAAGKVELLMGPGRVSFSGREKFKVFKFKYYDEIYNILKKKVSSKKYDVIIHAAAIPDYVSTEVFDHKIKSGKRDFALKFKPTIKIIDKFKTWDDSIYVVKFKLEVNKSKKELINVAYKSLMDSRADLIVANDFNDIKTNHKAYIIDASKKVIIFRSKESIAEGLINILIRSES